MPTYEYKCPKCGHFEVEQRITDDALTSCPTCGQPVKKLIPRKLSIQFKGPGFHVNDYPSGGRKASAEPATADAAAPAATDAPKSESKAAASE